MNALHRSVTAIISVVASSAALAASPAGSATSAWQRAIGSIQASVLVQVEYCMRNVPELRTELALTHATYSLASKQAAEILSRRFPNASVVNSARLVDGNDPRAREEALKQAQSTGYERLCPALVTYMHSATGESLAKNYGDTFADLLSRQSERNP
jgi:hypothetical protein